ncbi:MAG: hypothetical protein A2007_03575 [Verrucomicrobia bacterium GWC2_42_7]|nr:MAG: hypothetical protein A2007_03575 [Verrucomicrobia bacterium GWC2_42_7]
MVLCVVSFSALARGDGPTLATSAIIEVYNQETKELKGIILIERGKAPWGMALPGGHVESGETIEQAIRREMREEVHLELEDLAFFGYYDDPKRDPRKHVVEMTWTAKTFSEPKAGDDAAKVFIFPLKEIPFDQMAFDHGLILKDYLKRFNKLGIFEEAAGSSSGPNSQ